MNTSEQIQIAIDLVGLSVLANACGVTYQAIRKWQKTNRMPRTEWTGETNYCNQIENLTGKKVLAKNLMCIEREDTENAA